MQKSDEKPKNTEMDRLKAMIDDAVTDAVRLETRGLKMQVQSALDALEFYQKSVNLRLGALVGHETKKKQTEQFPTFDFTDPVAAAEFVENLKKKSGAPATPK